MLLSVIFALVCGVLIDRFLLYPIRKVQRISRHIILQVDISENLADKLDFPYKSKPDGIRFPLGNLAVFKELRFKESNFRCYAEIVFPTLDRYGKLYYEHRLCRVAEVNFPQLLQISRIKIAEFQKFPESHYLYRSCYEPQAPRLVGIGFPQLPYRDRNSDIYVSGRSGEKSYYHHQVDCFRLFTPVLSKLTSLEKLRYAVAREQLIPLVREHLLLIQEDIKLATQRAEIGRLIDLINTSEAHANRRETYAMVLHKLNELHKKSDELKRLYCRAIGDILIGVELAIQDSTLLSDDHLFIQTQYEAQFKRLKEEYQYVKDASTAYAGLLDKWSV
jgi:hypothetical protein